VPPPTAGGLASPAPGAVASLAGDPGVDFVGDVHGCFDALAGLLAGLGYALTFAADGSVARAVHPDRRRLVFLGDLVDRGPQVLLVLRSAVALAAGGHVVLLGNHDAALMTVLGQPQGVADTSGCYDGWATTEAALAAMHADERAALRRFLVACPHHALVRVSGAPLVVAAHAGLPREAAGRDTDAVWRHALYGDGRVADSREALLAGGADWRATYAPDGDALCVYGHLAGYEPACVAQTVGIDTGCGYEGGRLSALRWPEGVVRSVAAPPPPAGGVPAS